MSDTHDKLKSLLAKKALMTGAEWRRQHDELAQRRAAGEFELDKTIPGQPVGDGESQFYLVRSEFPLDTHQGCMALGAVLEAIPEHIALAACDPDLEDFDPLKTLFIDTETTGLSGGTGTVAFLVGVGYFTGNVFRLDQCFMRDYDEEEPMLAYLGELFSGYDTVVSYNGKSFDVPLLRTRFIANRMRFPLDAASHFDLLHVARRLWKMRIQDCSLSSVERAVLGIERHGDVPSSEIPEIWFAYLRNRDARPLERVFYHHRMDVLSLVALMARLSQCLEAPEGQGFEHAQDRLSLVRLHFRQRHYDEVITVAAALLESAMDDVLRRECLELLGFACKRLRDWQRMAETWSLMMTRFPSEPLPRLELAKHHEHRTRNLFEAERICSETVEFLQTPAGAAAEGQFDPWLLDAFNYRLARIRRKLSRAQAGDDPAAFWE